MYKQIIPINGLYAKYKDEDGKWGDAKVVALALDKEGNVCPLIVGKEKDLLEASICRDFVRLEEETMYPKIIQIIPANNVRAVFKDKEDKEFFGRIDVLALRDDGSIVPMGMDSSGYIGEEITETDNFVRIEEEKK